MYSVVLMAALTTGTDLPDWGRRGWGCCGCYGGWGWGGCYGGWGGCYGGWGGCYGGWGGYASWGYGGWGGGYGGWGGYGQGGYGGWGGYVYAPTFTGFYSAPVYASSNLPASTSSTRSMYYNPDTSSNNRATIIVRVPESASLTVNGQATTSTSAVRRFQTPPLDPSKSYQYDFEARMQRDGKEVKVNRRIDVSAGEVRQLTLTLPDLNSAEPSDSAPLPDEKTGTNNRRKPVDQP